MTLGTFVKTTFPNRDINEINYKYGFCLNILASIFNEKNPEQNSVKETFVT